MDVGAVREGGEHGLVSAHRSHDAQLDLRVVGRDEHVVLVARHDGGANELAAVGADRNVLQIGIGGGETSRLGEGLREGRVDASVIRIDTLRQLVHVGRLQLRAGTVLENLPHDGMVVDDRLQGLLVGRELSALRLLRPRGLEPELHIEEVRQLLGGVDVEIRSAAGTDVRSQGVDLSVEFESVLAQGRHVDLHALAFHFDENRHERLFALLKSGQGPGLRGLRAQHGIEAQRHIRILRRIVEDLLRRQFAHVLLCLAALLLSDQPGNRNWIVLKELAGEDVHAVTRGGVGDVVLEHRIAHRRTEGDAVATEHRHIVLRVLGDERLRRVGKGASEDLHETLRGLARLRLRRILRGVQSEKIVGLVRLRSPAEVRGHGDIPGLAGLGREAHADEIDGSRIRARGLGVEGELRRGLEGPREVTCLGFGSHELVLVRPVLQRRKVERLRG